MMFEKGSQVWLTWAVVRISGVRRRRSHWGGGREGMGVVRRHGEEGEWRHGSGEEALGEWIL